MNGTILINYGENTSQIENEEKNRFLRDLLAQMGVPIDDIWPEEVLNLSLEQRRKLRDLLISYSIQVLDDHDGNLNIYVDNELVGAWHKCTYKLKRDYGRIDPKKQLYLEMTIDFWTILEETETQEEEEAEQS